MHTPVLLNEVINYLDPKDNKIFLDCTFGAGGYTKALLDNAKCKVYAIDRDETVSTTANEIKNQYQDRFHFILGDFGNLENHVRKVTDELFDGIVFDLGVSSMQIDTPERGFSFYKDGPLDMRMSNSQNISAATIINEYSQEELADIFWRYGDEKKSRLIAKKIVEQRRNKIFTNTLELSGLISSLYSGSNFAIHPATKVFQALRIAVNDELNQLQKGLIQAKSMLKQGGILIAVTFHSGEDVIVKKYFNELCGKIPRSNRHSPDLSVDKSNKAEFILAQKGALTATNEEVRKNQRSRSAKLRAIKKL